MPAIHGPSVRNQHTSEQGRERRLADPAGTDNGDVIAVGDVDVEILDDALSRHSVGEGQIAHVDRLASAPVIHRPLRKPLADRRRRHQSGAATEVTNIDAVASPASRWVNEPTTSPGVRPPLRTSASTKAKAVSAESHVAVTFCNPDKVAASVAM